MFYSNIKPKDPFTLILANNKLHDKQRIPFNNTWEIQFDRGELGGISLYSTLSQQALGIRITPIISYQSENRINLNQFHQTPIIQSICTNYAKIIAEIFPDIEVEFEYWIPDSTSICGLVGIVNKSPNSIVGSLQFIVNLQPLPRGRLISGYQLERDYYLMGETDNITPVFFLSGNSTQGKFGNSSIESSYNIKTSGKHSFEWSMAYQEKQSASIEAIKGINFKNFDKEVTHIQLSNFSNHFQIKSGNPNWDKVFLSSQKAANQLNMQTSFPNKKISLIECIHPEKSFSSSNDYSLGFAEGINPLQLWFFSQVQPGNYLVIEDGLSEFLDAQKEDGFTPNHSSLTNPTARFHAFPILAKIAYETLSLNENKVKAKLVLSKLVNYLKYWHIKQSEAGSPYWENSIQTLFEDLPIHNVFSQKTSPINTHWINSPFLNTLLYQELDYCLRLAHHFSIDLKEEKWLDEQKKFLFGQIKNAWNPRLGIFQYKDNQSNLTSRKKKIIQIQESGSYQIDLALTNSCRLTVRVNIEKELSRNVKVYLVGTDNGKEIKEIISSRQFFWGGEYGIATSEFIYDNINSVEIIHLPNSNSVELYTSDYSQVDLTNCIPISIKEINSQQIERMITNWLDHKFLSPFGLPLVPKKSQISNVNSENAVDFPLNSMIIEALLNNNHKELALKIFERLMDAATLSLQNLKNFYKLYDADDGSCTGEYNIINGMVPLKLYFNLLGINRWTENNIEITGNNVIQNEVTIHFRGTKMICAKDGYTIFTSSGKSLELKENKNYKIKIPG